MSGNNRNRHNDTSCERLPNTATKAERLALHRSKMEFKRAQRRAGPRDVRHSSVLANLSKRHPDYGCSPAEHDRRKAGRAR